MASIRTGIELNDSFSNALHGIIGAVNLAVQSMENLSGSMNTPVDTTALQGARGEIDRATMALNQMNEAANRETPSVPEPPPPPQWVNNAMPIFTNSGVDCFQQEVQSANTMLEQLRNTQSSIITHASGASIFSPNAIQDLNSMTGRIDQVSAAIQRIESNPLNLGTDEANTALEQLRAQLNMMVQEQNNLNAAVSAMDVRAANDAYMRLNQTVSGTEQYLRDNIDEQGRFNQSVQACNGHVNNVSNGFSGWEKGIIVANQALNLIKSTLGRIGVFDMGGAFGRIDTMNRFQKTVTVMTGDANMAQGALNQLRETTLGTAYGLDVASKSAQGFLTRGMSLGAATNQVRIWADAVSFYGEGTNAQLENVVDAIGKMYSKGKVEANQLDRLFDAGIGAAEIYANAVGMSVGEVKQNLSKGTISATEFIDTVSRALDVGVSSGAAKEAGDSWATTFANFRAAITRGWTNVITSLDKALVSHGLPSSMQMIQTLGKNIELVLNNVGNATQQIVNIGVQIYEVFSSVGSFITDNWSIIAPIIYGIVIIMGLYTAALIANNIAQGISLGLRALATLKATVHAAALAMESGATFAATVAQYGLNAALLACPLTWIIILIIALIAIIFAVASAIAKFSGIANTGFGVITGGINVVIQFFKNLGLEVANIALAIGAAIGALGNNIEAAFHNAISSVQAWWYDLLSTALTVIAGICEALNDLPFVEFDYSGIVAAADDYAAKSAAAAGDKMEYESIADAFNSKINTFDAFQDGWAKDAFDAGRDWGDDKMKDLNNLIDGFFNPELTPEQEIPYLPEEYLNQSGIPENVADTAKNTKNSLEISEENLKYLRDLAEQEVVNRYTLAEVKIEQTNNNNINSSMDLDGVVSGLTSAVEEAVDIVTEGAFTYG